MNDTDTPSLDDLLADVAYLARHHDAEGPGSERYAGLDARIREVFTRERDWVEKAAKLLDESGERRRQESARADRAEAALRLIRDEIARAEAYSVWLSADCETTDRVAFDLHNPPPLSAWVPTELSWEDRALEWLVAAIARGLGEETKG